MSVDDIYNKPKYSGRVFLVVGILFIANLLINFLLIKFVSYSWIIVVFNLALLIAIILYLYVQNLPTFLLALGILPLCYIDNVYSLYFNYIIIQNIPLYIFFTLSIFYFFSSPDSFSLSYGYLSFPVFLITAYSVFLFMIGYANNNILAIGINELYQHLYYFIAIPIIYLIKDRRNFLILFQIIAITFLIISLEYIHLNLNSDVRITTYHNVFLSFLLGLFYSQLLFNKKPFYTKLFLITGIVLVWISSILINTRILWVCNILTMIIITYFYLRNNPRMLKWFKYLLLLSLILILPLIVNYTKEKTNLNPEKTEERLESLTDPLGDLSFLMRIEIGQAAIQKFLASPVWGEGFGNTLNFKIFTDTEVYFIDNSFLYFLWKGGLVGLLLFCLLYYRIIRTAYFVFNKSLNIHTKILSVSILGSIFSFILYGLLSASLIGYKLNFLYAIIIGYLEFERKNVLADEQI